MPADHDQLTRVETACAELAATGQPITFKEIAARAQISRTTLHRRADLRTVIDEHRTRGQDASSLTGLTVQIGQLRRSRRRQSPPPRGKTAPSRTRRTRTTAATPARASGAVIHTMNRD